jgi:two-component system, OmpR family, phosphate regulon response regulator PhoB
MAKVLLIEDDPIVQHLVRSALLEVCELSNAATVAEAMSVLETNTFDLIVLDIVLPDGDGYDFCKALRENPKYMDTPVVMLTSKSAIDERVRGFVVGADDYVVKPFSAKELSARVSSKLKKRKGLFRTDFTIGNFFVDLKTQNVSALNPAGMKQALNLTPIEFRLMVHFLQYEGYIFSRPELVKVVWGDSTHVSTHTVDTHISSLRKKMGESSRHLKAIFRRGYCLDGISAVERRQ